jgi:hypothetical protein
MARNHWILAFAAGFCLSPVQGQPLPCQQTTIDAPPAPSGVWPSEIKPDCPFPRSQSLSGIRFTGRHAEYTGADTWYPSWAADGNLYSPWTDGNVNGVGSGSFGEKATTGQATILGDDPLNLQVVDPSVYVSSSKPYEGRYPCGSLVLSGVWYYGTYCLHPAGQVPRDGIPYNWPWLGPFVGFRWSADFGKTWTQTPHTPANPLFGEAALNGEPVKIGAPHFVDFGKAMQYSPDGKAYLVAHGASDGAGRRYAYNSWITGDEIRLLRVLPLIENMNDAAQYEFFGGHDAGGKPIWTKELKNSKPIAAWRDNMGCVTMTYNPPLKKYLMCVTDGGNTVSRFNSYILESDSITGPFKLVSYLKNFGEQAYFVNIPSKFIENDGRTLWLCYAANFSSGWGGITFQSRPAGSRYAMCLQEVQLSKAGEAMPEPTVLEDRSNIAPVATVSVSSTHPDYSTRGLTDGFVGGFPSDISKEWCTNTEKGSAMVRLTWGVEHMIDRIWLFDRPNSIDQITSAVILFDDGTTMKAGALPDDAKQGLELRFAPKKVRWLVVLVDTVKPSTQNIGLAEIAVFESKAN